MKFPIIAMIAALETTAIAQPTAEDLYAEGQAAYDRGDYAAAITGWRASYELSGESGLLFNLAQAYRLSGNCVAALATYKQFITIDPTSDQRSLAEDLARELEGTCGARPAPITARPVPTVDQPNPINAHSGRTLKIAGLMTGSAGASALAIGLILGYRASSLGEEVTRACATSCDWSMWKDKDAAGRRDTAIGYALDALGVAAIIGGAAMYYLGDRESAISISPRPREGGAIVSWSGSW